MENKPKPKDMLAIVSVGLSCFAAGYTVGSFEIVKSKITAVGADIDSAKMRLYDIQKHRENQGDRRF